MTFLAKDCGPYFRGPWLCSRTFQEKFCVYIGENNNKPFQVNDEDIRIPPNSQRLCGALICSALWTIPWVFLVKLFTETNAHFPIPFLFYNLKLTLQRKHGGSRGL
jgi:hypothetical protein